MATYSALPATLNLVATVGNDFTLSLTVTENGSPWVATGATLATDIIDSSGTVVATDFTTAASTGAVSLSLTDTQTTTLGVGVYSYRLSVTKSSLTRDWIAGTLSIVEAGQGGASTSSASLSISNSAVTLGITSASGLASNITVVDADGYYASDEVEGVLSEIPATWKHSQTRAFLRSLGYATRPASLCVMGDSTGNETTEWPYLTATWLGQQYPAWTVHHRLWDDTAQGWGLPTTVQTGTAGEAYMQGDGASAIMWRATDSATNSITGDISIRVKFQPTAAWASGASQCLAAKFGGAGFRAWRFEITSAGNLFMEISPDGTTQFGKTSTATVGFSSASVGYVRVDVDVNNGASGWDVLFYTSPDGTNWTQLGTTVTTATATSIFDANYTVDLGARNGSAPINGKLYAVDIYNGIAASSPLALSWRAGEMYKVYTSVGAGVDCCGNVYTATAAALTAGITGAPVLSVLNASVTGADLSYFTNVTRFAKVFAGRIKLAFANISHNHAGLYYSGDDIRAPFEAWVTQMRTAQPDVAVVVVGQNPKISPDTADNILTHRDRVRELAQVAAIGNHGFVDVYRAFTDTGDVATYTSADGIHPNAAGQTLWLDTTTRFLLNA